MERIEQDITSPPQVCERKWYPNGRCLVFCFLSGVLVILTLVASWAPDSRMTELHWIPGWLAALADRDPNCRTAIPFIPMAFLLVHAFARLDFKRALLGASMVSLLCLGLSEFGQIFIPRRTADVMDLLWGGAGIAVGTGLAGLCRFLLPETRLDAQVRSGDEAP